MTHEEAIKILRETYDNALFSVRTALETICPELRESEDERIRRCIADCVSWFGEDSNLFNKHNLTKVQVLTYLEKQKEQPTNEEMLRTLRAEYEKGVADTIAMYEQKEQKPVEYLDKDKVYAIMTKLVELSSSQLIPINSPEYLKIHDITRDVRGLLDYPIEQNPAEWSEDDETCLEYALWCVTKTRHFVAKDACDLDACQCAERWLKSLRPHWKPSEEQMEAFSQIVQQFKPNKELESLYDQLKKL